MTTETVLTDEQIAVMRRSVQPNSWAKSPGSMERFARAIEQAVLQSPEAQRLREDAGRYRWIRDAFNSTKSSASRRILDDLGMFDIDEIDPIDETIDSAIAKQP